MFAILLAKESANGSELASVIGQVGVIGIVSVIGLVVTGIKDNSSDIVVVLDKVGGSVLDVVGSL
jgi:hypothetical protein